jgi:3-carboxy-cis,cis-muconate cycloisomerase
VSDGAWLTAMLAVEAALARACAAVGLIADEEARAIAAACRRADFDVDELGRAAAEGGNPVIPLVALLRGSLPAPAAGHVHLGATSQDILDTAAVLVTRAAVDVVLQDAERAADAAAALADTHRDTAMIGRTLLQQALPITFGLKAAGWMSAIDDATLRVRASAAELPVALGGPVGTLAGYGGRGLQVRGALARELGLAEPLLSWHTLRAPLAGVAGALALMCGALGKAARDVTLLAQSEVAEVHEGGRPGHGGSSSMAHKRNPVAAVAVVACAQRVPALAATLHATMVAEHERAAGAWHAEWEPLSQLLRLSGSAAAWAAQMLSELVVDGERMGVTLADAVARNELSEDLGETASLIEHALGRHREQREQRERGS